MLEHYDRGLSLSHPFHDLERWERGFFGMPALASLRADIQDQGDSYLLEADMPGFKKEDIHIDIEGHDLTIRAERRAEAGEKDEQGNYIRCERSYGSFHRRFDIANVQEDAIKASYHDGVLRLTLPKKQNSQPAGRRLEIE